MFLNDSQAAAVGGFSFGDPAHARVNASYEGWGLIVLRVDLRCLLKKLSGFLELPLGEASPREKVVRLEELGVQPDRRLEFLACLVIPLAERNGNSTRHMGIRQLGIQFKRLPACRVRRLQVGLAAGPPKVE